MHEEATSIHGFIRLITAWTSGKPPPYNIICVWPQGLHPNVILFRDSQVGSPEILKIGTIAILEAYNILCKPSIKVRSKAKL
jgi:hypothetical protein